MFGNATVTDEETDSALTLWDYMNLHHDVKKSDIILVLGNHDTRTAEYAAKLFLGGYADWLMFSGDKGVLTIGKWDKTEAEVFCDVALKMGVPREKIILETEATNTGKNVSFSYKVLQKLNLLKTLHSYILIQMPHMERRVYATFMKQWPGDATSLDVTVSSPSIPMLEYPNDHVGSLHDMVTVLVGSFYRVKIYPDVGFQIEQHIPEQAWLCYEKLIKTGKYSGHMI
ncbi:uncharacterized protein LOC110452600 [Mizuhopecten yessoensis]|uniref:DUF218 domain-containing protein n=1 Tax=Mizuhopecten yessoensis TaxID=6573 RepID=A0A210QJ91_MIZYE|nr:uncharacterized protein LOC110452600 [Mizuhopecten yessoensis]OWF48810.1 hypothetical protein KP79_PYT14604 [Mizuhopecten yessoensis]